MLDLLCVEDRTEVLRVHLDGEFVRIDLQCMEPRWTGQLRNPDPAIVRDDDAVVVLEGRDEILPIGIRTEEPRAEGNERTPGAAHAVPDRRAVERPDVTI